MMTIVLAAILAGTGTAAQTTAKPMQEQWLGILSEDEFKALHELRTDAPPALRGEMIELAGGKAYVSRPQGEGPHPGVLVIQEWWGLNDHIKHWTDRLAADGYVALAPDMYDGVIATTSDEAMATMQTVKDERAHAIVRAGLDQLKKLGATKVGSIGWCFGGGWSLQTAIANPDVAACVIYYGRVVDDVEALRKIKGPVCGVFGNLDQGIPKETVDKFAAALQKAQVKNEIHRYEAVHAFANPSNARYDGKAAGDAWEKVRAFLAANLQGK